MKFFIDNQEVGRQVENVFKKVRLHMNGETSRQMGERGIVYRTNYGVGIPHLKEIAQQLPVSYELAERLWFSEIRETMILAAMIVPHEEMNLVKCREWAQLITNRDLVERTAPFLFGKLDCAAALAKEWIESGEDWLIHLGCYTLGWNVQYTQAYTFQDMNDFLSFISNWKYDRMAVFAGSISFIIRKFIRHIKVSTPTLDCFIQKMKESTLKPLLISAEEIQTELEFVRDL